MISNYRSIPIKRFSEHALRVLDLAWRDAMKNGNGRVGVFEIDRAITEFAETEIVASYPELETQIGFDPLSPWDLGDYVRAKTYAYKNASGS